MLDKPKVLVVDDNPANLEVISETVMSAGYQVATAVSGERALKRLAAIAPDLILLDVQMPGIDGFEVCRQIKANPETADIPIIFITALSDVESIAKGFSLGAVDYISKPFRKVELLARLKTHLTLSSLTKGLEQLVAERTTTLQTALDDLQASKLQLVQHEKMSALGNLVAGVAHEINNPIGFIQGSVHNGSDYLQDLLDYIDIYQQEFPQVTEALQDKADEIDLDFLREDFSKLFHSMEGAINRIEAISTSLRTFSRADTVHKVSANLHEGLDSTLLMLKYRLKGNDIRPEIKVRRDYRMLPEIPCFAGQLNQVFMNILANAIDAFDEAAMGSSFEALQDNPQILTIKTKFNAQGTVEICIRDNGKGMTEETQSKIFEHLFTTKGVGKGTGLGLAIAQQIVTEAHGGQLAVWSEVGQGTEFLIRLPYDAD